jgi:hypothetical protein
MSLIVYSCWQPAGASEHTLSRASMTLAAQLPNRDVMKPGRDQGAKQS